MEASLRINIILVTYNNLDCIRQSTTGIFAETGCPFDLFIVDNHSTLSEGLVYYSTLENCTDTFIIPFPKNLYYFPAVSVGQSQIRPENWYTVIANDDIIVESVKGWSTL